MVISHSGAVAARPAYRNGLPYTPGMENLVPGDYRQTEEDLAAFPQPVLDLLSRYGTRVAILADGQTLADSPGLRTMAEQEVAAEAKSTNAMVTAGVSKAFANGIESYEQLETVADAITRELRAQGIDNSLGLALSPFSLEALADARKIP